MHTEVQLTWKKKDLFILIAGNKENEDLLKIGQNIMDYLGLNPQIVKMKIKDPDD